MPAPSPTRSTPAGTRLALVSFLSLIASLSGCLMGDSESGRAPSASATSTSARSRDLPAVTCRLRESGDESSGAPPDTATPDPIETSAADCSARGGEYDRDRYRIALRSWEEQASNGDPEAQTIVGEAYERGLAGDPDYEEAAKWYQRAADQGSERAMLNLGYLYELGQGVEFDPVQALSLYSAASGLDAIGLKFQQANDMLVDATKRAMADATARANDMAEKMKNSFENATETATRPFAALVSAAVAPPTIQLIEPPVPPTRGISVVAKDMSTRSRDGRQVRTLVGRADAPAGLVALFVNDVEQEVDDAGLFRASVPMSEGGTDVVIAAVDRQGRRAERQLRLQFAEGATETFASAAAASSEQADAPGSRFGDYHALVIGNGAYRYLPDLATARADATAVAALLEDRYGFDVTVIEDANRYDILSALNDLRARLTDQDNLLIYYAGHGELDRVNMRGQWLPVDAEAASTANWISNVAVTDILNTMNTRHVLVVSDSCYSGSFTRSSLASLDAGLSDEKRAAWVEAMASKRSRTALTSGGLAPVLDIGGGGHSVFARALLDVLEQNESLLEGQRLYQELSARVTYAARNLEFEQLPQYAPIKYSGHEAGDFLLVPRVPRSGG